ncbi:MAG: phage tail sheath family protein [Gammaproteobacteria bacterium]|nr:phage tail sheath family protein [Gammaproteobacteria bacterium]
MEQREALIEVLALDRGAWGNRLQVSVADVETSLVQANLDTANGLNPVISLSNYTNVEAGTVLEFFDANAGDVLGTPAKVVSVDRAAGEVELDAVLHGDIVAAHANPAITVAVRSREFVVNVFLLQRPDPAVPSRNNTVIDSESFIVTLDPRHSRYIHRIIGTTWDQIPGVEQDHDGNDLRLWDRRSEGESRYIRVRDVAAGNIADLESIRLGPEILEDRLDNGQMEAARLPLADGGEGFTSIINDAQGDNMYLGVNSDEPRLRTGIHALRNIQDISIVAVPGQTTVGVQQGLINHCENDRYRFAVLDAHAPNQDTLVDVQIQRQAFDTRYAALYHPWLTIPEPLPQNIASIRQMPVPPSGYMMGIYARVDNNRGVHKAPANEVVRGITGLTRSLNKREQDILNPFPKNINVVRDFREANRGLRVWGARCITSDSDYKYVNVRRLMIFLEASIDRGLQWVVFEPNADPLWARVRRSVTNFLNVVWRNGALEGTTPDQAFFVRCDRTTMTQTDIDNGRLICEIGVAPVKPAEFVIVRIGLWTASAD